AWVDLKTINEKRREAPIPVPSEDWDQQWERFLRADPSVAHLSREEQEDRYAPLSSLSPQRRLRILESIVEELKQGLKGVVEVDPTKLAKENLQREQELEVYYWLYLEKNNVDPRQLPADLEQRQYIVSYAQRNGIDPRLVYTKGFSTFSVWFHVTDPT